MGGTSLVAILTNLGQLETSTAGGAFALVTIALAAGYSALHGHAGWLWTAIAANGVMLTAGWLVTTIYGVGVGGG